MSVIPAHLSSNRWHQHPTPVKKHHNNYQLTSSFADYRRVTKSLCGASLTKWPRSELQVLQWPQGQISTAVGWHKTLVGAWGCSNSSWTMMDPYNCNTKCNVITQMQLILWIDSLVRNQSLPWVSIKGVWNSNDRCNLNLTASFDNTSRRFFFWYSWDGERIIIVRPSRNSNVFHHNMCLWSLPKFMESHHETLIKTPVTSQTKHSHDQQHRNFVTHFIAFHHRIAIASYTRNPGNRCPRTIKADSRVLKTQVHHSPIPIQSRTNSSTPYITSTKPETQIHNITQIHIFRQSTFPSHD